MLDLDGSAGGGGLFRSALALSAVTGEPFRMEGVRGGRPEPGLRPQHLAALRLLADVTGAAVEGASEGAEEVSFDPGDPEPGAYEVGIGTAGSVTLVFDAVLPLALAVDGPLSVTVRGGTDVPWSPPVDYYARVKLPLLWRLGVHAAVDTVRTGFYPAGGGEATLRIAPSSPSPIDATDRGAMRGVHVYSTASTDLADAAVAGRGVDAAVEGLEDAGLPVVERAATYVDTDSPGYVLVLRADYGRTLAGFDALGERGTPAEEVAAGAVDAAAAFHEGGAAVDRHMADQLLPFLALAGGRVRVPDVTDHVAEGIDLAAEFGLPVDRADGPLLAARPRFM